MAIIRDNVTLLETNAISPETTFVIQDEFGDQFTVEPGYDNKYIYVGTREFHHNTKEYSPLVQVTVDPEEVELLIRALQHFLANVPTLAGVAE